ncbi:hypothetical protein [Undibacterium sp. TS12]|uniref:hypothetical protein n=1 Tax=Undibacterium sp. TS12 TaxID=2908202 RepID=UPI001F4CF030|nr:hypothetical protein [Undibacterium sp. TS12]MCH8620831.1 hypothetical protein [Undibacterium sp. TS12]
MRIKLLISLALAVSTLALSGCVVAPAPGYGYGYGGPNVYVRPAPVIIDVGPRWGGGYHHWRRW